MRKTGVFCCLILLAACAEAPRPNLSGAWKTNRARSRMTAGPVLELRAATIEHREPELKIKTEAHDTITSATYSTDGSETCNVVGGSMMCSKARWSGNYLEIDSTWNGEGTEMRLVDRWSLAPDRRSLTVQRHIESGSRKADDLIFLEKQ